MEYIDKNMQMDVNYIKIKRYIIYKHNDLSTCLHVDNVK